MTETSADSNRTPTKRRSLKTILWAVAALLALDFIGVHWSRLGNGTSTTTVGLLAPWLVFFNLPDASKGVERIIRFQPAAFSLQSGALAVVVAAIALRVGRREITPRQWRIGVTAVVLGMALWSGSYLVQRNFRIKKFEAEQMKIMAERAKQRDLERSAPAVIGPMPADIADVPALDLHAGNNPRQRFFLVGLDTNRVVPKDGYKLMIVLPGGDGGADFTYFVRRIYKADLDENWIVAQLVAPTSGSSDRNRIVWPLSFRKNADGEVTTEDFVAEVISDIRARTKLDGIYMFAWSSGGPPTYTISLSQDFSIEGAFIAMSVFRPDELQLLSRAAGKRFFLLQSPEDKVTKFHFAERAKEALTAAGAEVEMVSYPGGHGWRGPVHDNIRRGIRFLEAAE